MKVGTDGVLLGAWTNVEHAHRILDIGTGTGLISLMLAQRNADASIVGIEIDEDAADQAEENVRFSPFSERIDIRQIPFQEFSAESTQKFDLLVSNPPFFADSLHSPDHSRSLARHSDTLSLEELFCGAKQIATKHARFSVIIPYLQKRRSLFAASDFGWHPARITHVFSLSHSKFPKRILVEFTNDARSYFRKRIDHRDPAKRIFACIYRFGERILSVKFNLEVQFFVERLSRFFLFSIVYSFYVSVVFGSNEFLFLFCLFS